MDSVNHAVAVVPRGIQNYPEIGKLSRMKRVGSDLVGSVRHGLYVLRFAWLMLTGLLLSIQHAGAQITNTPAGAVTSITSGLGPAFDTGINFWISAMVVIIGLGWILAAVRRRKG